MKKIETLATCGGVDQWPAREAPDELVAAGVVACWKESGQFGFDQCYLRPALQEGERVWLITRSWTPKIGYSAEGTQSDVISFDKGLTLLEERKADLWFPPDDATSRDLSPGFDFERHKALEERNLEQVFWHEEPPVQLLPTPPKWQVLAADDLADVVWKTHLGHGYWYYPLARVVGEGEEDEIFISLRVPGPWALLRGWPACLFVTYENGHDCDRPGPWRAARKPAARAIVCSALLKRAAMLTAHAPALVSALSDTLR